MQIFQKITTDLNGPNGPLFTMCQKSKNGPKLPTWPTSLNTKNPSENGLAKSHQNSQNSQIQHKNFVNHFDHFGPFTGKTQRGFIHLRIWGSIGGGQYTSKDKPKFSVLYTIICYTYIYILHII